MRAVGLVAWCAVCVACQPPEWGKGAPIPPGAVGVDGVTLRLDATAIATTGAEIAAALVAAGRNRLGALGGVTLETPLDVGAVTLELGEQGLIVVVAVGETTVTVDGDGAPCMPRLLLGPGTLRVPLAYTTDALGRLDAQVPSRASWQGPLAPVEDDTCTSNENPEAVTELLLDAVAAHVRAEVVPLVTSAIGGLLPARFATTGGPGAEAALRARADAPVTRADDGLAVHYALHVNAATADCLAPFRLAATDDTGARREPWGGGAGGHGLLVPVRAVQVLVEAWALQGNICGFNGFLAGPFALTADASAWPAPWSGLEGVGGGGRVVIDWQPDGPPAVTGAAEGALAVDLGPVRFDAYLEIEGAFLRVASATGDVALAAELDVTVDGFLALGEVRVALELDGVEGYLLPPPDAGALADALAQSVEATLSGVRVAPIPPGLTVVAVEVTEHGDVALRLP